MPTFDLSRQTARINSVNPRAEKHGDEDVPAVDVKLTMALDADCLVMFGSRLRASLFETNGTDAGDLGDRGLALRNSVIEPPISLAWCGVGYEVTLSQGLGLSPAIVMPMATLDKVAISPREGGAVEVSLSIRSSEVSETDRGRLTSLIRHEVLISTAPPQPQSVDDAPAKKGRGRGKQQTLSVDAQ